MIYCLLVITFFTVIARGPAGLEFLERRREKRDRPLAKVVYLPSAACREPEGECGPPIDPVLRAVRERRKRELDALHRSMPCACDWFCPIHDQD